MPSWGLFREYVPNELGAIQTATLQSIINSVWMYIYMNHNFSPDGNDDMHIETE